LLLGPRRLQAFGIPLSKVKDAIRASNLDVGGRVVELTETEFMVRGRGYLRGITDLEQIVLKAQGGSPVLLKDVARVELAPDERRGVTELNGEGEVAAGIAVQRYGENALSVIANIKQRIGEIAGSLPEGTAIVPVYDRSELIYRAIDTLRRTLLEESVIVALVCVLFLLHVRSALVAIITLPLGVLMAYISMHALGLSSNIMSLGGIAIAIGAMVDAAIVMIENAHKHLERAPAGTPRINVLIEAACEVGPALFFSLLIITVSFLPIFTLEAQEGRLFKPLAFTKTFAMAAAALLAVTLVPALMVLFVRGRIIPEHRNPINRALIWVYRPVIAAVLKARVLTIVVALVVLAASLYPAMHLGAEFMPNLNEGTLMYMPTTLPGISITKSAELLQTQNKIIKSFPEVESVFGKAGRAATATDPAPTEMIETAINLKPTSEWRPRMTLEKLISEMDRALQFPGVSNAWTMPIKARIDMLATGIRTPLGVKVIGPDLVVIEKLARDIEAAIKSVPGTASAFAERIMGGYYLEIIADRAQLARYGLMVGDVQAVIASGLGAEIVTTTVEGRERYGRSVDGLGYGFQSLGGRCGWLHRARRCRSRNRRGHVDLSRSCAPAAARRSGQRRASANSGRSERGDHGGGGRARATQDDDCGRHHGGTGSDTVEQRNRLGDHAANCGAHDRGHGLIDPADPDGNSRDLWTPQGLELTCGSGHSTATYGGNRG
jgi:copper/silver efflux system protein